MSKMLKKTLVLRVLLVDTAVKALSKKNIITDESSLLVQKAWGGLEGRRC